MPEFTAGNQTATVVDEAIIANTGYVLPDVHPPSAPTPSNPQGPHEVTSTEPAFGDPNYAAGIIQFDDESPESRSAPSQYGDDYPLPHDHAVAPHPAGTPRFSTPNGDGTVATFQRASQDFTSGILIVSAALLISGRLDGKESVTLWCPSTDMLGNAVNGFIFGETEGELQQGNLAAFLLPGQSVTIRSEAPVWAAQIPGGSGVGTVCYKVEYNPPGGSLGSF